MSSNIHRKCVLSLYRQLLLESKRFDSYIYRKYAIRRIRDAFRQYKNITEEKSIETLIIDGQKNLELIKRQVVINNLYKTDKLVVESIGSQTRY